MRAPALTVLLIVALAIPALADHDAGDTALDRLDTAIDLYDMAFYEDAATVLLGVDLEALPVEGRQLHDRYAPAIRRAAATTAASNERLRAADRAADNRAFEQAGRLWLTVAGDGLAPDHLRGAARQKLADLPDVDRAVAMTPAARRDETAAIDHVRTARDFIEQGWDAVRAAEFERAQELFNQAWWHVPQAPPVSMYINPQYGVLLDEMPMGGVQHIRLWARPRHYVTMNLQLGVGRLISMDTFRFTNAPVSGVGAGGFVQLPNVQRIQLKTTVTAPAYDAPENAATYDAEYLVLVRPRI